MLRFSTTLLFLLYIPQLWATSNPGVSKKVRTYTQSEVRTYFDKLGLNKSLVHANNGIDVYQIIYEIPGIDKNLTQVSGLILIPQGTTEPLPILSYQHGTDLAKADAPSVGFIREFAIAMVFAADGYAVTMPDYLGLGLSEGPHPYMHTITEADAVIGLIRTVKKNSSDFGISFNDQLYLTGYSQGGHATMAAQMVLERDFSDEFTVTASAPMSGVYDLSGIQSEMLFGDWSDSHIGYLPYLIFSYDEVYGLMDSPTEYFKPPYDTLLPPMFDGTHSYPELVKMIPRNMLLVIHEKIYDEFVNNPKDPFRMALEDNNVYEWVPKQPIMMCYCKGDRQVNWKNAKVTERWMSNHGASFVKSKSAGRKFSHRKCAYFAPAYAKWWFDGYREGKPKGGKGPMGKRFLLSVAKIFMGKN